MSFVVAIDGPAGSGKGTITNLVGKKANLINIDTGATFRCVALDMILKNVKIEEENKIKEILEKIKIELKQDGMVFLNGKDVTKRIRESDVSSMASKSSTLKIIRDKLLEVQREIANGKNVIMEGRDIGTVVFPDADVKIYLDATKEERARRRLKQNQEKGIQTTYEEVLANIIDRDTRDSSRKIAPLKKADDAIYIDTTNMTIEEVANKILEIIETKKKVENI